MNPAPTELLARDAIRTIIVPTDFSPGADLPLGRALLLPLTAAARVHIAHVLPSDPLAKATAIAKEHLAQITDRAHGRATARFDITSELLSGEPFVELLIRLSRNISADLIVMGRHGQRSVRDMFVGTTAERVIRMGDVPVLAVKLKPEAAYRKAIIATISRTPRGQPSSLRSPSSAQRERISTWCTLSTCPSKVSSLPSTRCGRRATTAMLAGKRPRLDWMRSSLSTKT